MSSKSAFERFKGAVANGARRSWGAVRRHPVRAVLALPVAAVLYTAALYPFTPSIGDIRKAKLEQPTVVLSADGKELATFKRANRDWVKLSEISPHVAEALVATEDHRFFDHHGMDFKRTATALLKTIRGDRQGGSTITQQLARNLYPDQVGREPTITRKIKEAITALKIEAVYTKEEILETYLNTVPFLYNAYGIEMAARTYFDKSADKLDVVEAATLVGMLKGTSFYNPVLNPERSLDRRNTVLAQMVKRGKLEDGRYEQLKARPLKVDFERQPEVTGPAPHMARQLRQWLVQWADERGYNIYADGLVVRTTIDSRLQAAANRALTTHTDKLQPQADARRNPMRGNKAMVNGMIRDSAEYKAAREQGESEEAAIERLRGDEEFMKRVWDAKTQLQAGFMAMDPATGAIRAWVGSRDFNKDQFDHVSQARRQPGSTFKPFVYAAAFEQGLSPYETFMDGPVEIRIDRNQVWRPTDVDGFSNQPMTLRDALATSKNTVTAQLMQRVGPERVAQLAQSMGVRDSKLERVPSLALGTSPVTLKEMVASYGTIANNGNYVEPQLVARIEDREGTVLEEFAPQASHQALSENAAHLLLDSLRAAIDQGTGVRIRAGYGIKADVAGKTGTTQNDTDGWFIMMHPQLVAGAWVGFNDARITMLHDWGQGARSALPIVGEVFQVALRDKVLDASVQFAAPRNAGRPDPSLMGRVGDWFGSIFGSASAPEVPERMPEVVVSEPVPLPQNSGIQPLEPAPRLPDASVAGTGVYGQPATSQPGYGGTAGSSAMGGPAAAGSATDSQGNSILSLGMPGARGGSAGAAPASGGGSQAAGSGGYMGAIPPSAPPAADGPGWAARVYSGGASSASGTSPAGSRGNPATVAPAGTAGDNLPAPAWGSSGGRRAAGTGTSPADSTNGYGSGIRERAPAAAAERGTGGSSAGSGAMGSSPASGSSFGSSSSAGSASTGGSAGGTSSGSSAGGVGGAASSGGSGSASGSGSSSGAAGGGSGAAYSSGSATGGSGATAATGSPNALRSEASGAAAGSDAAPAASSVTTETSGSATD